MEHKPIPKQIREQVFWKYSGHCAYCGCELEYKDMQVDHIESVYVSALRGRPQNDDISNLMPACRACNFYKSSNDIEGLRRQIYNWLEQTCRSSFQVILAMKYGILEYKPWNRKFYFEMLKGGNE